MLVALAIAIIAVAAVVLWPPNVLLPAATPLRILVPILKWDLLLVICLAANIAFIARHQFFIAADIGDSGYAEGTPRGRLYQAMLQKTLEQTVLAIATHGIWALTMPRAWQGVIPVAAILFVVGRLLFWRGYAAGAEARSLGVALTFYPTVMMILLIAIAA